jgi:hypothetical protein
MVLSKKRIMHICYVFQAFMDEAIICFDFFCLLLQLGVYKLRKPARRRMVTLSVQLSDCMEAFDY